MLRKLWVPPVCILSIALVFGCAGRAVRRAPTDSIPEDADFDTRTQMLEQMVVDYPDDPYLFFTLGNVYYDEAQFTLARSNYEKALSIDPKMNSARVNLAMLLAESDEPDSAKALLAEAIRIDPDDAKAYNNLGMIYYTEKNVDSAVKYYSKGIALEPGNAEAHYNLGLAFAEAGLLLEAIREWRTVLELTSEDETAQRARLSLERAEKVLKK